MRRLAYFFFLLVALRNATYSRFVLVELQDEEDIASAQYLTKEGNTVIIPRHKLLLYQ